MKHNQKIFFKLILFISFNFSDAHATIYYITSAGAAGAVQLDNAITQANLTPLKDTVYFNIPGTGPFIIDIANPLPEITKPLVIDGFSQPGNDTALWLIRFTGGYGFIIESSNCYFTGLRITGNFATFGSAKAFYIKNKHAVPPFTVFPIDSVTIEQNYMEDFYEAFNIEAHAYGTGVAIKHVLINENKFVNNNYGMGMNVFTPLPVGIQNIVVKKNTFTDSGTSNILGYEQTMPHNYLIEDNVFYNSNLDISGRLKTVHIHQNEFRYSGQLELAFSPDSVVISENHFSDTYGLVAFIEDTASRNLYFENNNFFQTEMKGLDIEVAGAGSTQILNGMYIRNNSFIDNYGITVRVSNTSGTSRLNTCEISGNTISYTPSGYAGQLINYELSTTGGIASSDSVVIKNNVMNGGGIIYQQSGTGGSYNGTKIHINNNTISPNGSTSIGVAFEIQRGNVKYIYIDSNTVSNMLTGIQLRIPVAFGYTASISNVFISHNDIIQNDSCGIILFSWPSFGGNATMDSVFVSQNRINSNQSDGVRIWCVMDNAGHANIFTNMSVSENEITGNSGNGISFIDYGDTSSTLASPVFHHLLYSHNSILNNGLSGINIENRNDPFKPVTPIFPFPSLTNLIISPGSFIINGNLQADSNQTFTLEFFQNAVPDPSGSGEGETYIGSINALTNSAGYVSFQFPVSGSPGNFYFTSTATNVLTGNTSVFSNVIDFTTDIEEINSVSFNIFPNPTSGKFTIQSDKKINQITITNLSGQIIFKKNFSVSHSSLVEINLNKEAQGIYLIQVITDSEVTNQKIIVQ